MKEQINYTDEIKDKEDMDFKVEIGKNKDGDRIIRVSSKQPDEKEYVMLMEMIANRWSEPFIDESNYKDLTYVESMNKFFKLNPCEFSKEDIGAILKIVNKYGNGYNLRE